MATENIQEEKPLKGQMPDANNKCACDRCEKKFVAGEFYMYKDGSRCRMCKKCLTAFVDPFDPETFVWILKDFNVPYVPTEWNSTRDKVLATNPKKIKGPTVVGKYLSKMRLSNWGHYTFADSEEILEKQKKANQIKEETEREKQALRDAQLKVQLSEGKITEAEYNTLVSAETRNKDLELQMATQGDVIIGIQPGEQPKNPYEEAMRQAKNPFQEQDFMSEEEFADLGADLSKEDKLYLAVKWGRLYKPSQWLALEQLYEEFMKSFADIQDAARIDTLKMICKTSLKMNEAIDSGDIDSYQKLSRVYDSMMKSAKFTEAQKKKKEGTEIDSASAIVNFVEANGGQIPKYHCDEPQDKVDKIILDLKEYTKNLIYDDKSLAQEIEKYLQDKHNADQMKKDKEEAREKGLSQVELEDEDYIDHNEFLKEMVKHDDAIIANDDAIEMEYAGRRLKIK